MKITQQQREIWDLKKPENGRSYFYDPHFVHPKYLNIINETKSVSLDVN